MAKNCSELLRTAQNCSELRAKMSPGAARKAEPRRMGGDLEVAAHLARSIKQFREGQLLQRDLVDVG